MLILTSTLYHQETGFTTFLHKSSFITFVLKTSFTPILYESTLAFKNTKVWMYSRHDFQHLGEDEVNFIFFFTSNLLSIKVIIFWNFFIFNFNFFKFTILYWFCHKSTWIPHGVHMFPILNPPPTSLPIPSLWVIPVHQPQASYILHRTWTCDSLLIWYYTCFKAILPNHPLSLSHRVQKTVLYICVSFTVSHTRLSLPSF